MQLVAKLEDGEYMSFGLSGDTEHSQMVGGDVAVVWVDRETLKGYANDYYLDAKSQCAGVRGSCPDEVLGEKTNSIRLLNAAMVNGYSIVTYQRPLKATDELDRSILTNGTQPIIWAIGPLNSKNEVSYHSHFTKGDRFLEFGRAPEWNCPMPESEDDQEDQSSSSSDGNQGQYLAETTEKKERKPEKQEQTQTAVVKQTPPPIAKTPAPPKSVPKVHPWEIPPIQCDEPSDGVFYAQMGPTGGKQGYPAITGHVGWGISWYINGLLIPEITLVRGKKYTFVVEGGSNPDIPARYHPFYITDDPIGGYEHATTEERSKIKIFAGVRRTRNGELVPTGVGRLCNWTPDKDGPGPEDYPSFGAYQRTLTLVCENGNPGVITWTPDHNTPDTVYYQCFTHRYLGWKIHIVDECDTAEAEASEQIDRISKPDDGISEDDLLLGEESYQVETRVKPDNYILDQNNHKTNEGNKGYNFYNGETLTGEMNYNPHEHKYINQNKEYELPVSKVQLKQVIDTVENLENQNKQEKEIFPVFHKPAAPTVDIESNQGSKETLPETPIREDEEVQIDGIGVPSSMMLPPNAKPLTLQTFMRPGKPAQNPNFRRPIPPEIKQRRPIKPGYPMRNTFVPGQQQKPQTIPFKKMPKPNNRLPNGYNRPQQVGPQMFNQIPPNKMHKPQQIPPQHQLKPNTSPLYKTSPAPVVVMAKPVANTQMLNVGPSAMTGSHVVKSKITLPHNNDHNSQQTISHPYLTVPNQQQLGQIILGKPIESPLPLDQQMIQTKVQVVRVPATVITTTGPPRNEEQQPAVNNDMFYNYPNTTGEVMRSSDLIGESLSSTELLPTAVNTGFKPESIVIESGFKPIIREPLMANEDRIADYPQEANRREDTDILDEYDDTPISNFNLYPSEKMTESFEPIFIPSPLDKIDPEPQTKKPEQDNFPPNHAKEDRPYPVYSKESDNKLILRKNDNIKKTTTEKTIEIITKNIQSTTKATTTTEAIQIISAAPKVERNTTNEISDDYTEEKFIDSILKGLNLYDDGGESKDEDYNDKTEEITPRTNRKRRDTESKSIQFEMNDEQSNAINSSISLRVYLSLIMSLVMFGRLL